MTRIFVEDIELDISGELSQQLTFAIDDLNNLDSKSTSFSKTIVIPGTNLNNQVFGNIFEFSNSNFDNLSQPNVYYNFNASRSARARIEINGLQAMKGVMRLLSIVIDRDKVEYEIALFGELGGFVANLSNKKLTDIDFSDFNHTWSADNIQNSWEIHEPINITTSTIFNGVNKITISSLLYYFMVGDIIQISGTAVDGTYSIKTIFYDTIGNETQITINETIGSDTDANYYVKILNRGLGTGNGYIYPLINYGNVTLTFSSYTKYVDFLVDAFRPAIFVKTYFDRIIQQSGYTYESNFMESDFFKRLIIPHNEADMFNLDATEYANIVDDAVASGVTSIGNPQVQYNLPLVGSLFQFGYSSTFKTLTYTGSVSKQMKISGKITGTTTISYGSTASFDLMINGVSAVSYPLDINGTTNVDFFFDYIVTINPNDVIEFTFNAYDSYTGFPGGLNFMNWALDVDQTLLIQNDPPSQIKYSYGDFLNMNNLIPKNIFQKDFVTSLMKMFNLMVVEDQYKDKHLKIEPYIDFFQLARETYEDWSDKVDRSKPIRIKPMSEVNARYYNFKYKQDSDYYLDEYRKKYNEGYGDRIYDNNLEFAKDSQSVEVIFSSSVITEFDISDKVFPSILKLNGQEEERINHNIRIMQAAIIDSDFGYVVDDTDTPTNLFTLLKYCYAGHVDNPRYITSDINFGSPEEVRFVITDGTLSNNLFNAFYSPYMAEITDKDSRLVTCDMYLNEVDIFRLDFSKFKMIDGVLYRLEKIIDWSSPSTCKVELLRVINTTYSNEAYYVGTAKVCDTLWSNRNLDVTKFNNGDEIPLASDIAEWAIYYANNEPACAYPNFNEANKDYGLLYNQYCITDPRGLAPEGWRISTTTDWDDLDTCIDYANEIMEVGTFHWANPYGSDLYGFKAYGSGRITSSGFSQLTEEAYIWNIDTSSGLLYIIYFASNTNEPLNTLLSDVADIWGASIRLVKI